MLRAAVFAVANVLETASAGLPGTSCILHWPKSPRFRLTHYLKAIFLMAGLRLRPVDVQPDHRCESQQTSPPSHLFKAHVAAQAGTLPARKPFLSAGKSRALPDGKRTRNCRGKKRKHRRAFLSHESGLSGLRPERIPSKTSPYFVPESQCDFI